MKVPNSELESPFEEEVYRVLLDNFDEKKIIPQFKFAEFRIDIVYDPQKEGLPKIAIECDGAAYHSSNEAYLHDHHRQKILESHGFVFHRIWSTNWWRNPKRETKALIEFIKKIENQRSTIIKSDNAFSQAFTDDFSRMYESWPIKSENLDEKNKRTPTASKLNKLKIENKSLKHKTWESQTCYWSTSELPGYSYAPNMKAWYKKKNVEIPKTYTEIVSNDNFENVIKVNVGSIVKIKSFNSGFVEKIQLVDYEINKHEVINGIRKVSVKSLVGVSIRGKSVGDIVKIGNLDNFVEILEIK